MCCGVTFSWWTKLPWWTHAFLFHPAVCLWYQSFLLCLSISLGLLIAVLVFSLFFEASSQKSRFLQIVVNKSNTSISWYNPSEGQLHNELKKLKMFVSFGPFLACIRRKYSGMCKNISVQDYLSFCCCAVTRSCPTLCDPMNCSTPGFPILHYLLEFAQIHACWVGDAVWPSHPLPPSSPFVFNLSQD